MKKSAVKFFIPLFIFLTVAVFPLPIFGQTQGSVKGIFDAIRNYRQKSAPVTLDEVKEETQELDQAKMELDQTIVEKQAMMLNKTKEQLALNLDQWSEYLRNIKQKYAIPTPKEFPLSSEYLDAELTYIDVKKGELPAITTKEGLTTFISDLKVHRQEVLSNLGQVRVKGYQQVITNLEARVSKTNELLVRFDNKLTDLSARGFETGEAAAVLADTRFQLEETAIRLEETRQAVEGKTELTGEEGQQVRDGITNVRQGLRDVTGRLGEIVRTAVRTGSAGRGSEGREAIRGGGKTGKGRATGRISIPTEPVVER